jgi:hypothetical protein
MHLYYLGLDLGQPSEMSALAIIEEQVFFGEAWANEVPWGLCVRKWLI